MLFKIIRKFISFLTSSLSQNEKKRIFMDLGAGLGFGNFLECPAEVEQGISLLDSAQLTKIKIAVDVGANVGKYTSALLNYFPSASIFSFEPGSSSFDFLKETYGNYKFLHIEKFALGSATETGFLNYTVEKDPSAYLSNDNYETEQVEEVQIIKGEDYFLSKGINKIDWLKIDAEGMDFEVLIGFNSMIKRIEIIQFEISAASLGSAKFLDFWRLLSDSHRIFRISPNGPQFVPDYSFSDEIFWGTNYLAVRMN